MAREPLRAQPRGVEMPAETSAPRTPRNRLHSNRLPRDVTYDDRVAAPADGCVLGTAAHGSHGAHGVRGMVRWMALTLVRASPGPRVAPLTRGPSHDELGTHAALGRKETAPTGAARRGGVGGHVGTTGPPTHPPVLHPTPARFPSTAFQRRPWPGAGRHHTTP